MKLENIFLAIMIVTVTYCLVSGLKCSCNRENMTGFGVTSGLAFNNRVAYCQPGNEEQGGSWSGGCFLPHRVIV